jgi:hypothetical protein
MKKIGILFSIIFLFAVTFAVSGQSLNPPIGPSTVLVDDQSQWNHPNCSGTSCSTWPDDGTWSVPGGINGYCFFKGTPTSTGVFTMRVTRPGYTDGTKQVTVLSDSPSISGPSSAYVSPANLNAYTATFSVSSAYSDYQWEVYSGGGTIVGSSTSNQVTIDFDSYGGKQIRVKVKANSGGSWSPYQYKSHTIYPSY